MADVAERRPSDRSRFLTFALAAAEMLVEVSADGVIGFAAGAFQARLGSAPDAWIGRPAQALVALGDRNRFDQAFLALLARDRLPPVALRLADAAATPMSFAGLRMLGQDASRLCLTVSALPDPPPPPALAGSEALRGAADAALRMGDGAGGVLGLLDIQGEGGAPLAEAPLREAITAALPPGGLAGELAPGRFSMLAREGTDLAAVAARVAAALTEAGEPATAAASSLSLETAGLTPFQASRALRYALSAFGRAGPAGLEEAGLGEGLSGFIATAAGKALWLRQFIEQRRFRMAFQPIHSLRDGELQHHEALIRPDLEPGSPVGNVQDFVTYAEVLGLSEELDWAVFTAVCAAARRSRGTRVAVNVSAITLQSPEFRARMLARLEQEPLLRRRLLVEVTETAEIEDEAEAVRTVDALRAQGLPVCLDDFGAGAAALHYLRAFRVDYVKIDGSYVQGARRGEADRRIVEGIVAMAKGIGARTVAERVETAEDAALMRELGVELGQGWHYGRPGPLG